MRFTVAVALGLAVGCASEPDEPEKPDPCEGTPVQSFEPCDAPDADPSGPVIDSVVGPSCVSVDRSVDYEISFQAPADSAAIVGIRVTGHGATGPRDPYESRWSAEKQPKARLLYGFGPWLPGEVRLRIQFIDEKNRFGPAMCGDVSVRQ